MTYTREYLNELYLNEVKAIRTNSINKIITYLHDNVLSSAKKGNKVFTEYFPEKNINDIKDELSIKLAQLYPDCDISYEPIVYPDGGKCILIRIDWSLDLKNV
jgi:hypothetical protein